MNDLEAAQLLQQGLQYFRIGQLELAANSFNEALKLSRRLGNQMVEGVALNVLGNVYLNQNKFQQAIESQQQAFAVSRQTGNYPGEGAALGGLGFAYLKQDQPQKGMEYLEKALPIFKQIGDRAGECQVLSGLGNAYTQLEQYSNAINYYHQALAAAKESDNPTAKATVLSGLADVYLKQGEYQKAIDTLKPAVSIFRDMGNPQWEGEICVNLGKAYDNLLQYHQAIANYEQALTSFQKIGDRNKEANLLLNLGVARSHLGQYPQSAPLYERALTIFPAIGDRQGEGKSLLNLGINCLYLAEYSAGIDFLMQALKIFEHLGDLESQGLTLERLGYTYTGLGQFTEAISSFEQGLKVVQNSRDRLLEGIILSNLGNALTQTGQYQKAFQHLNQALTIAQELDNPMIRGQALTFLGNVYLEQNKYQEAIETQTYALSILKETDHYLGQGAALGCLGLAYLQQSQYQEGIKHLEEALPFFRQTGYTVGEFQVFNGLGNAYIQLEDYPKAIDYFQQALNLAKEISNPVGEATALARLGDAYVQQGQYQQAIDALESVRSMLPEISDRQLEEAVYINLGKAYAGLKQFTQAIPVFEQGLEITRKLNHCLEEVLALDSLSIVYLEAKEYEQAIQKAQQVLTIIEELDDSELNLTRDISLKISADNQYVLGTAYIHRSQGKRADNLEAAITYLREALQVFNCENFPHEWADTKTNLAVAYLYRIQGVRSENLEESIKHFEATLDKYTKESSPDEWARTQMNLGHAYTMRIRGNRFENIEASLNYSENALNVFTQESHPIEWAKIQSNLGAAYATLANAPVYRASKELRTENLEKCIQHLNLALEVLTCDNAPVEWIQIQINLAHVFTDLAKTIDESEKKANLIEEAIHCCQSALQIYTYAAYPEQWAEMNIVLAIAYINRVLGQRAENLEKSIVCFEYTLQVYTRDAYPRKYTETQYNLGRTYKYAGQFENAYRVFHTAIEMAEQLRSEITLNAGTVEDKRKLAEAWSQVYPSMVEVCLELNRASEAIEYVERSKNQSLVELLTSKELYPKQESYHDYTLYQKHCERLDSSRQEIVAAQQQLESLRDRRAFSYQEASKDLQEKVSVLNTLLNEIKPHDESFNLTQQVNNISFSEIQTLIDNQTAILEWYLLENRVLAFIITPHSSEPIIWQSSPDDWTDFMILMFLDYWASYMVSSDGEFDKIFTKIVKEYRKEYPVDYKGNPNWVEEFENRIRKKGNNVEEKWGVMLEQKLERSAKILHIDEILNRLPAECKQLIIVPYRGLHMLPFHALPIASTPDQKTPIKRCLLDKFKHGVRYVPSCQLLQLAQSQQRPEFNKLITIQDPRDKLDSSGIEVENIRSLFPSWAKLHTHSTQQDLSDTHCIHFACHGSFNPNYPLESTLSRDPRDIQKKLTLAEIFGLSLNQCCLVTLSACETGLTEPLSNSDEYITLASGFLYAGSPNVVSSLWKVRDISTAFLMIKFYQNLQDGESVAIALNQAQLWLRNGTTEELQEWTEQLSLTPNDEELIFDYFDERDSTAKPFQSPYHWAAFCAIGQ